MKRLNLVAAGLIRREDLDFSDDGNRFRGYEYAGMPITYLYSDGYYFLSIREDYLENSFTWADWHETEEYKLCDEFNYVESVDIEKVKENCIRIKQKVDELNKKVQSEEIDTAPIIAQLGKEIDMAQKVIDDFKKDFKWYEAKRYDLTSYVDYMNTLQDRITSSKKYMNRLMNGEYDSIKNIRYDYQKLQKHGYVEIEENNFYIKQLKEALTKY